MRFPYLAGSLLLFAQPMLAQFNLYPAVSPKRLVAALNVSSSCLTALNATVSCDQDLFQMAGNADAFFWDNDNATALCTSQCLSSASAWWSNSVAACENQQLNAYGRVYPVETVPGRFLDGLNIVCLTPNTDVTKDVGINGTLITFTDIGGMNSSVDPSFGDPQDDLPDTPVGRRQTSVSPYCIVQSYDWTGSDIIRPNCDDPANANQSQCVDPTDVPADNNRIANLYPDSLLCSQCFLKMFYLRLASPYLPDLDQSDYMVAQWYDILDVCKANSSMPELIVRTLPYYQSAPGFSIDGSNNATDMVAPVPDATCTGRLITLATLPDPPMDTKTQTACDVIPPALNASTGDVIQVMGTPMCLPNFNVTKVCLPLSCQLGLLPDSTTCDQYAKSISTSNTTVTTTQLLTWNPNFIGLCSNTTKQYVCTGAPGGTYIPPHVANSTSSPVRGGGGGSTTGSGSTNGSGRNSTYVLPGQTPPSPTQSGISSSCTRYAMAQTGDGCTSFASSFGLTLQALVTWNPVLGPNGANCATMLQAGVYYCLGVSGTTTTSAVPSTTSPTSSTPSPVQSGISPQCAKYAKATTGEYCSEFAPKYSITPAQLYAWNPVLGADGANCGTQFQANTYYCVGVSSSSTTTSKIATTTSTPISSTPSPVQSGISPQCTKYALATSGEYCSEFAPKYSITPAQLYAWNPILGADGANCGTQFQANTYYCVGAPAAAASTTSKRPTTTSSVLAPGPTQSGITSSCNKFAAAIANDGCATFASRNAISTAQLYAWNTVLGASGQNCASTLWANEYYCVGVAS